MSCICLDTNWFLKGLESPCPPDWTALSALFSENSDAFSLPHFPMQVHDVLLAYGIIENPNIRASIATSGFTSATGCTAAAFPHRQMYHPC